MQYIRHMLGAPQNVDVEGLKRENEQLKQEVAALKKKSEGK
jgi:cell division protein FtsB